MWQALRGSLKGTPEVAEAAGDLMLSTSRRLILTMGVAYLIWHLTATLTWPGRLGWEVWGIGGAVMLVTVATYLLIPVKPTTGIVVWLGGFSACVTLAILVYRVPELSILYALLPVAATALLGWRAGALAELGVGLAVWGITQIPDLPPVSPGLQTTILLTGALGALLGWALEDTLLTVTNWSLASYAQAHDNMAEARQRRGQLWPVTVALQNIAGSQIVEWNVQMAGALIAALPTLAVYILLGRFFLRGHMAGALKG